MADKFPVDAPKRNVLTALERLGFQVVREAEHIALRRINADGSMTPMTIPDHRYIKARLYDRNAPKQISAVTISLKPIIDNSTVR